MSNSVAKILERFSVFCETEHVVPIPEIRYSNRDEVIPEAFHATESEKAVRIQDEGFNISQNPDLRLGDDEHHLGAGVYFFQNCRPCAWAWTRVRSMRSPVVLKCTVSLGDCLDLLNPVHDEVCNAFFERMRAFLDSDARTRHALAIWSHASAINLLANKRGSDTVRARRRFGVIRPSGYIMICVRNKEKISNVVLEVRENPGTSS